MELINGFFGQKLEVFMYISGSTLPRVRSVENIGRKVNKQNFRSHVNGERQK